MHSTFDHRRHARPTALLLLFVLTWWTQTIEATWNSHPRHLQNSQAQYENATIVHLDGTSAANRTLPPGEHGERNITLGMGCPEFLSSFHEANVSSTVPYQTFSIIKGSGYAYVTLHFQQLWLPVGASIVLRAVEDVTVPDRALNLSTIPTFESGIMHENATTPPILTKELRVELYRDIGPIKAESHGKGEKRENMDYTNAVANDHHCYGFAVHSYTYVLADRAHNITPSSESTCANDNSKEAICYYADTATRPGFLAARTVARLLIQKEDNTISACTGWLLGSEGHLLTNNHCANTTAQAKATTVEFMAEAYNCSQSCAGWGDCPGTVEAISTTLVHTNYDLDYTLLKLETNVNLTAKYGYLRLKQTQASVNQEVYIPQHPLYYGKRIAMINDYGTKTTILNTAASGCGVIGYSYNGDTQAGSSGSPVIDAQDHGVVALHHCGQACANTGIPSINLIADMQAAGVLPNQAVDPGDKSNTVRFPNWQPPEIVPLPPLLPNLTFNGIIQRDPHAAHVSVDQFKFTLDNDAYVAFDVLSAEVSDDGKFKDLNGDCQANYLDTIIFLYYNNNDTVVLVNDDDKTGNGKADGSISRRDSFAQTFLKAGDYMLALTAMPADGKEAFKGKITLGPYDPEIYTCKTHSNMGSYRIQFNTSQPMKFTSLPTPITITNTCSASASSICS